MISISCEEFNKLSETGRMAHTLATEFEYIKSCLERGDYDRLFCFGNLSLYGYTNAEVYGLCHDYIPEDRRYDILLRIYTHARSFDGARGHLKEIKKYRPEGYDKELLPLADKSGRITVYRGVFVHDGEKLRPPRLSVSWTVNPSVAHWFASRFPGENERRVYQGTVHLKDVIAYINDRSEEEVILCGGIRNIGEIPVDEQKGAQWRENVRHKGIRVGRADRLERLASPRESKVSAWKYPAKKRSEILCIVMTLSDGCRKPSTTEIGISEESMSFKIG